MNMTSEHPNMASDTWNKVPDVIERIIDGEAVLLDLKTGVYFSLNETGSLIWELLDGVATIPEISEAISKKYEADIETIENAVTELMLELEEQKLVERAGVAND